jgi:hypothetical protein
MTTFKCERCGYETGTRCLLKRHFERRNSCLAKLQDISIEYLKKKLDENDKERNHHCKHCDKSFTDSSNMYRHQKKCNKTKEQSIDTKHNYEKLCEELKLVKQQLSQLQQQGTNQASTSYNTTNNNIHNTTINNTTIQQNIFVMRNFGEETYHHISDDFLSSCILKDINGVKSLIEKIHFSDDAPENKNIRLKSSKKKHVEVNKNHKWEVITANEATETMINNGSKLLNAFYYNLDKPLNDIDDEEFQDRIQTFLINFPDKNSQQYKDLKGRIYALIENYRNQ